MATNNNTQELDTSAEAALVLTGDLANLREAFDKAHADFDHAEANRAVAAHNKAVAAVWMSRIAFRTMTHPDVANKRYPQNITGAAKVLGMPVGTLRPYGLAGIALDKKDMAGLLSVPGAEDIAIVDHTFEVTTRAAQKEKRVREAARKAKLEAKAKELDALKANGAKAPAAQAPAGAPAAPGAPAPASGAQAPASGAPAAPAPGVSLEADVIATAKQLVAGIKLLKSEGSWAKVSAKVLPILAEAFPVLKK